MVLYKLINTKTVSDFSLLHRVAWSSGNVNRFHAPFIDFSKHKSLIVACEAKTRSQRNFSLLKSVFTAI
ncbi:hypothetical protein Hdeb2414_s0003g00102021 [Helianthus debilis subsp. tardiflorus]